MRTGRRRCARRSEAADALVEEAWLPRADDVAWGWQHVACFLAVLLVVASMAYIYAQMAAALVQTFNQPVSPGSEWEALALRNGPIPSLALNWQAP